MTSQILDESFSIIVKQRTYFAVVFLYMGVVVVGVVFVVVVVVVFI